MCQQTAKLLTVKYIHAYIVAKILQGKWIQSWKIWFQFTRIYSIFVSPKNQIFKFSSLLRTFCTNNFTWKIFYEYIETKIISTFLRTFSVQKIKNSFVVLITWLTCTKTFAYVHIYIYIILEKIAFTWQNISVYKVFHVRRILRLLRISRTSFYTWLSSGSAFSR